jgi:hypothetical protein
VQADSAGKGVMIDMLNPSAACSANQRGLLNLHLTLPWFSGRRCWQGLENLILDSARTHGFKACVFATPVFTDEDPMLEKENIRVPLSGKWWLWSRATATSSMPLLICSARVS